VGKGNPGEGGDTLNGFKSSLLWGYGGVSKSIINDTGRSVIYNIH